MGRGGRKEIMHGRSQWAVENPCSNGRVPSKLGDNGHMVHSRSLGISFCMYKFEKVTRGADRHDRA